MRRSVNLWDEYRDWLLDKVNFHKRGYDDLMDTLHNSVFEVHLERDNNRLRDGAAYRDAFFNNIGIDGDFPDHPIGVLEVLVAFAIRIETEFIGDPANPHPEMIFWEMICNLELDRYDNNHFNGDAIYNILGIWICRKYQYDSFGCIFPLRNPIEDPAKMELWAQMTAYINEKYV